MDDGADKHYLVRQLELAAAIILPLAASTYFVGWVYLNKYFGFFGIDLGTLDISFHFVLVHAFVPFAHLFAAEPVWMSAAVLAFIVWANALGRLHVAKRWWLPVPGVDQNDTAEVRRQDIPPRMRSAIIGALLFGTFVLVIYCFFFVANVAGAEKARAFRAEPTKQYIFQFGDDAGVSEKLAQANDRELLYSIIDVPDAYYVFRYTPSERADLSSPVTVFRVPKESVVDVRYSTRYQ